MLKGPNAREGQSSATEKENYKDENTIKPLLQFAHIHLESARQTESPVLRIVKA
jgi:hypothetical protein